MGILDYIYLSVIVIFVALGLFNLWYYANKRRNDSFRDYVNGKEQRMSQIQNR